MIYKNVELHNVAELRELEDGLKLLSSLTDRPRERGELIERLRQLDRGIRKACQDIRL